MEDLVVVGNIPVSTLAVAFDLIGTYVFGLSGALLAVRRGLDIFGIAVLSLAAALAGGVFRDMMLGAVPVAALMDSRYLIAALGAGLTGLFFHGALDRLYKPVMVLDAMGLSLFAVTGCNKALAHGLGPLPAIMLGVITATGGGVIRDVLVAEIPRVLREEVYAMAALIGGAIYVCGRMLELAHLQVALVATCVTFLLRVVSVWRGWQAPRAVGSGPRK
ncbi:trimeric intracellular cation channel family protein [Rhodobacteraceae bacterium]|nr:trimeric intracellular cation channel family protein [Paracoccaceae bacterium]